MSRKIIKAISINNLKGVVVDSRKWHGKKLYRVFSRLSDKLDTYIYTYSEYKDGKYIKIPSKAVPVEETKELKIPPNLRNISTAGAVAIREEQIENFKWVNSMLDEKLDLEEVIKIINETPIMVFPSEKGDFGPEGRVQGYYHPNGFVAFNLKSSRSQDISSKLLRFHEYIHLIQERLKSKDDIIGTILNEAQTESLALRRFSKEISITSKFRYTDKEIMANFNFYAEHYSMSVSLLRQMETIMGRRSYEKNFYSARDFSDRFIDRYGIDLYTFIVARMEIIEGSIDKDFLKNEPYYIEDTQNKLFKEVFRQEFEKVKNIEDAKELLSKLSDLELSRIDLYDKDNFGNVRCLNQFESLYNRAYKRVGMKLLKLGFTKEQIVSELEKYRYSQKEFYPIYTEEEIEKQLRNNMVLFLQSYRDEDNFIFDSNKHKITYLSMPNGDIYIGIIDRKEKFLLEGMVWQDTISRFLGKELEISDEIIEYLESDDAKEYTLSLKEREKLSIQKCKNVEER